MGVAMAMALLQWWPGRPGILEGKRKVTVGYHPRNVPNVVRTTRYRFLQWYTQFV